MVYSPLARGGYLLPEGVHSQSSRPSTQAYVRCRRGRHSNLWTKSFNVNDSGAGADRQIDASLHSWVIGLGDCIPQCHFWEGIGAGVSCMTFVTRVRLNSSINMVSLPFTDVGYAD